MGGRRCWHAAAVDRVDFACWKRAGKVGRHDPWPAAVRPVDLGLNGRCYWWRAAMESGCVWVEGWTVGAAGAAVWWPKGVVMWV
ncbi:hypothetical protein ACLOJK_007510 [Asimina triloba]